MIAGDGLRAAEAAPVAGLRLGVPRGFLTTEWDNTVGTRFGAARKKLSDAGARVTDEPMPLVDEMLAVNAKGGFAPAEAFAVHRERLAQRARTNSIRTCGCGSSAAARLRPPTTSR